MKEKIIHLLIGLGSLMMYVGLGIYLELFKNELAFYLIHTSAFIGGFVLWYGCWPNTWRNRK